MKVSLITVHFTEYVVRLGLALAEHATVQAHLVGDRLQADLSPDLRREAERRLEIVPHESPRRATTLLHGWRLYRSLRSFAPDLVHGQEGNPYALAPMLLGLSKRTPFVYTIHDPTPHSGEDLKVRARDGVLLDYIRRRADRLIVHGDKARVEMEGLFPAKRGRIDVIPHGVLGDPTGAEIAPEQGSFLFFGRIEAYKGLGVLLAATRRLLDEGLAFHVTIAGHGGDLEMHRPTIAALPCVTLDERFIPGDQLSGLLRRHSAIVMPYLDATQSGVLAHAFGAGRPVVATAIGGLPEVIQHGENGLLAPPNDVEAFANAMRRFLVEPGLAERLGNGASNTAATVMSWERIASATMNAYCAAAGNQR